MLKANDLQQCRDTCVISTDIHVSAIKRFYPVATDAADLSVST